MVRIGARWDEPCQNERLVRAHAAGLIDYVEANYPVNPGSEPRLGDGVQVFVHCPVNPIASPQGLNPRLAEQVKHAADAFNSPWVGEHLCWAGPGPEGRLGYIVTPLLTDEFVECAAANTRDLSRYYGRPVALELAPMYQHTGTLDSEMHFLSAVARQADCRIILDVAHWTASNRNLGRPADYGLDALEAHRIVELHVAGIRPSNSGRYWHDSHDQLPEPAVLELTAHLVRTLPALQAVTFEHADAAPEDEFMQGLESLRAAILA